MRLFLFMIEHTIPFEFTGRYYTTGDEENIDRELWIVLHGYGQLARLFIPKFNKVSSKAFVVAPEGLSLFYSQGVSGRVGSTWMTREFREEAINNYVTYINSIYQRLLSAGNTPKRTVLFAFSQGVSTLIRWVVQKNVNFDKMILWAGDFPADVDRGRSRSIFSQKEISYVYGNQDHFITSDRFAQLRKVWVEYGLYPEVIQFTGDHEVPSHVLEEFF